MSDIGIVGLVNLGNTCYANSIIQVFRSIPALTEAILLNKLPIIDKADPKLLNWWTKFTELVRELWRNKNGSSIDSQDYFMSVKKLVKRTVYDMFGELAPNDSHEYYGYLLDNIQKITHEPIIVPVNGEPSEIAWAQSFKKDWSKIVPLFYGQIKKSIKCKTCNNISNTYEVFNNIKVDLVDNNALLIHSIKHTFKDEDIDGYSCDACGKRGFGLLSHKIIKTPPYLCITINRFVNGFGSRKDLRGFKLNDNGELDLEDNGLPKYSLMSIIDHHGSMMGGHYTTQIKHYDLDTNSSKEHQWYLYDDESVHELSKFHLTQSAYMLFFRKI